MTAVERCAVDDDRCAGRLIRVVIRQVPTPKVETLCKLHASERKVARR